uniref:NADH-ubiquinone oxidoreductase chain 5 n=1 Tax=Trigonopterus tounensis TaxID=2896837 RepID=A0A7H1KHT4_9CUCU|nr:NADH dehydrogenase subunit 5 [Trigonopterus tounensis]
MVVCRLFSSLFLMVSFLMYALSMIFSYKGLEIFLEYEVLSFNTLSIEVAVYLDWISFMFTSFVFFISSMIIIYSESYMEGEKNISRFVYTMVLFVLSMMIVIMSSNLVFILLGWDGLGLVSYVLVIYYQNVKSYNAGMLTALSNRIGDASILLGIALMVDTGSWSYLGVQDDFCTNSNLFMLGLLIILASMTKSAQVPFSSWLPAAMAAPTPVSSLVHSSTLVTAGVYLLFRFSDLLSCTLKGIFLYFFVLTMFMAGLGANFECDLKKIIALSTLSQLGMMMVIFSLGEKDLAFFHLLMHALCKALLFMCAGVIIHNLGGCQDIRYMGGVVQAFPVSSACFCISSLALCGLPFLSGFYSKDLVVEALSMSSNGCVVYLIFFISVGLTVSYSMRLLVSLFIGQYNMLSIGCRGEGDSKKMLQGMVTLGILVILQGSIYMWTSLFTPYFIVLPLLMKLLTLMMIIMGAFLGYTMTCYLIAWHLSSLKFYYFSMFVSGMWNMPVLSTSSFNSFFLFMGKVYMKSLDFGWTEYYSSKGLFSLITTMIYIFQLTVWNHLKIYLMIVWGAGVFIILFLIN